ncbi:MAG: 2-iminobutanoate/2-iminopropanoate deaminase [Anaerolineales bacterium]|nr:2-iminobutanoate/2-iminopropanoate deaminase [Anaerolineales bacterium]
MTQASSSQEPQRGRTESYGVGLEREVILTEEAPAPVGPYSQAIRVDSSVFVAGQVGMDPATGELADGIDAQTRQALQNLAAVLGAAGGSLNNVVKTTVFLADLDHFTQMNEVYAEFFPGDPPARSAVQVARLPLDALVEIEAIGIIE